MKCEEGNDFLLCIPYNYLKSLCSSNQLCISDEKELVTLFERYLEHREGLPLLPEEDPSKDWSHLTPEEKEAREKIAKEKADEEAKTKEADETAKKTAYDALNDLEKFNFDWAAKVEAI